MHERFNGPVFEPQILISKRKYIVGSARATLSHCPTGWGAGVSEQRQEGRFRVGGKNSAWPGKTHYQHLLQRYQSFSPFPGPLYTHSRFSINKIFLRECGGALCIFKSKNLPLYKYWPISLASQPQFSTLKPYPTNILISNGAKKLEWEILYFQYFIGLGTRNMPKKHWGTCNYRQCVSSHTANMDK